MEKRKLKPSSSYFLSQKYWRLSRNILGKKIWTYSYKLSQKIKFNKKIDLLKNKDLELINNLKYPNFQKNKSQNINGKKFSYYLDKFNSSKPDGEYRIFLDELFLKRREKFKTILEIGIAEGAGINALKEYFYKSYLWGVDIDPETFIKNDDQIIKCSQVDQLKLNTLVLNANEFGVRYDLIIDDGWHHPESQLNSLIAYLPYLNINGVYIIEDIVHRDYFSLFQKVKNLLENKNFKVTYKNFFVPGRAEISDLLGYMIIERLE